MRGKLTESKTKVHRIQIDQRGIDRERGHQKEQLVRENKGISLCRRGSKEKGNESATHQSLHR